MTARLVLGAVDQEDLEVLSAHVQDAIVAAGHMTWEPGRGRFVLLLNRYVWENRPDGGRGRRVQAGLHFDGVRKVRTRNLRGKPRDVLLNLLSIGFEPAPEGDPGGAVVLTFSGGAAVRLDVECLDAHLRDIGKSWKARARPSHPLEET
ncbi:MAG: DUF2948 family protein [Alphaproteobacteria bacterium]